MKKHNQRLLSAFLAVLMMMSLLPTAAYAAVGSEATQEDGLPAVLAEDLGENFCRPTDGVTVTATASGVERWPNNDDGPETNLTPDKVIDGDTTSKSSRWSSDAQEKNKDRTDWIQIDLGTVRDVGTVKIFWERNNVLNYNVKLSETELTDEEWNAAEPIFEHPSSEGRIAILTKAITLTQTQRARYVRVSILERDDFGENAATYFNATMYEIEVYSSTEEVDPLEGMTKISMADTTVTASGSEAASLPPEKAIDGDTSTRWSSQNNSNTAWIILDLHRLCAVTGVKLYWERDNVTAYTLDLSTDGETWNTIHTGEHRISELTEVFTIKEVPDVRYVRVNVTGHDDNGATGYRNIALWEIEVYGTAGALITSNPPPSAEVIASTPSRNLCRPTDGVTVTASASSEEASSVAAANAIDGNTTSSSSRWGSAKGDGPHSLTIDLGAVRAVSVVKIFWERLNVLAYNLEGSADNQNWMTLYTAPGEITETSETLTFDPVAIRYLKLNITSHKSTGLKWDGTESVDWNTVSLFEIEAYRDANAVPQSASDVLNTIRNSQQPFAISQDNKLILNPALNIPEDFTVTFAANLEQVIGKDGTVYQPIVNKHVEIDLTVTDNFDSANSASTPANSPITILIGGQRSAETNTGNAKPAVIPEIMEWYSNSTDHYTLGSTVCIRYRYAFADVAQELKADLEDLFGVTVTLALLSDSEYSTLGNVMQSGDIVLYDVTSNSPDTRNYVQGYDEETYGMDIFDNKIYIYATHSTGAYWGTRTLLQGLKLSGEERTFPNGTLRDYPEFKLRGFVLDVGRKPVSMDMLQNIVKNMAWYKMNDFQVHLNDNLISMEDYKTETESWDTDAVYKRADLAYSAFRLESDIQEEPGAKPLTARDYAYTKDEYKAFVENSAKLGVSIMSEIDVPAHAKAITDAFPSLQLRGYRGGNPLAQNHPYNDHLDLSTQAKHDASVSKTQEIFDEYLDNGIFGTAVDFGADEYYASGTPYRRYVKDMITYLKEKKATNPALANLTIRQWGSLTQMSSSEAGLTDADLKPIVDDVQLNLWNTSWANPNQMYNLGYDLINTVDYQLYIVPKAGYYFDYIPHSRYTDWTPNNFNGTWLPASSDQVIGAAYALWNDCVDTQANGISEQEVFDRFFDILPYLSVKMWGEGSELDRTLAEEEANAAIIGLAPRTNPYYKVDETDFFTYDFTDRTDKTGNGHDLTLVNAEISASKSLLALKGGASYAETGLNRLGFGSQLSFRALKLTYSDQEEILFEGDHAYGDFSIKALPVEGKTDVWTLGFSRELYDYEFEGVELPLGQWVSLTITNEPQCTTLSVDGGIPVAAVGKFVSKPDSNTQFWGNTGITNSSFEIPVARIGSKTNAFYGYISAVTTGEPIVVPDAFITATAPSEKKTPASNNPVEGPASYAVDGDLNTMWHSNYSGATSDNPNDLRERPDKRYIQLNIATPVTVRGLSYTPRADASNGTVTQYRIEVSTDGKTFTPVAEGDWARDSTKKEVTFTNPQPNVIAVRLYGVTTYSNNQYMSALEVSLNYDETIVLTNDNTAITISDVTWYEEEATAEIAVSLKPSGFPLVSGTDYTVTDFTITTDGQATITITAQDGSNYSGSVTATFTVPAKPAEPVDISTATVTFAQASYPLVNGKAEPAPIVKVGSVTLLQGLDYTVSYRDNTGGGIGIAVITGIGEYTGMTTGTFTITGPIVKKNLSDTTKTKITLPQTSYHYTGSAITPEPHVTYQGQELVKNTDYTVTYRANTAIGTATVTVTGRDPYYEGSASATFTIVDPATATDISDRTKTTVTFAQQSYDLVNGKAEPEPTVRYDGKLLVKGTDYTVSYTNNTAGGTGVAIIRGVGAYIGSFAATFNINGGASSGSSGGGSTSSGGALVGNQTTVEERADGSTVTTTVDALTGTAHAVSRYPDGTKVDSDTTAGGVTTATVKLAEQSESATVIIPTKTEPSLGQVAVIIHPDGTQEVIKTSVPTKDGLAITVSEDVQVKIVDNTKTFIDVPETHWGKDAITFVTSREIFNGTGSGTFTPNGAMSRAMVCTVLANLEGVDVSGGQVWYEKAVEWAEKQNVSDGTNPSAIVSREQLVTMLYRYAGSPATSGSVEGFVDANTVSNWAAIPMAWAIQNGIITGRDNGELDPLTGASRAEVAVIFQRYLSLKK